MKSTLRDTIRSLDKVYALLNEDAMLRQEHQSVDLEWRHFCMDNGIDEHTPLERRVQSVSYTHLTLPTITYTVGEKGAVIPYHKAMASLPVQGRRDSHCPRWTLVKDNGGIEISLDAYDMPLQTEATQQV